MPTPRLITLLALIAGLLPPVVSPAEGVLWIEGEDADRADVTPHSWYGAIDPSQVSGGAVAQHWDAGKPGHLTFRLEVEDPAANILWLRANPVQARLSLRLNGGEWQDVDFSRETIGRANLAADGAIDLRFIAWTRVGEIPLREGGNTLELRFASDNHHHGFLDVVALAPPDFRPVGILKPADPGEMAAELARRNPGWSAWIPGTDPFEASPLDLRFLNQERSGADGRVVAREGRFFFEDSGEPVRFWGVNGPSPDIRGEELRRTCRTLAKRGVNLLRLHGAIFDRRTGEFRPEKAAWFHEVAAAAAENGIYIHLSIYFPLWFEPRPGLPFLDGYDGASHPFAALQFNPAFQQVYQDWWRGVLLSPGPDGSKLIDHPALMGVEIQNEDSYLFWTFSREKLPEPQLAIIEGKFGEWVRDRYGSYEEALKAWNGLRLDGDRPGEGRVAFRGIWHLFNDRTPRDRDTVRFLYEEQRAFYQKQVRFLRDLGFRGLITTGNWQTGDPRILGPIETMSYFPGDFLDRHGYFGIPHEGQGASWSVREGHLFSHRSALRMEGAGSRRGGAGSRSFGHPVMDPHYNDYPSMLSETAWTRPNRHRGEAPLFYAIYGALQDSDAIVHFSLHSGEWDVQPGAVADKWTLMAPTQAGQFPAAALIYRLGLVDEGPLVADIHLSASDLLDLQGSPLAPSANLDDLREADVRGEAGDGGEVSPLLHLVGRTRVRISAEGGPSRVEDIRSFVGGTGGTVRSATDQVFFNFASGRLAVNAPKAQVVLGDLGAEPGPVSLSVLRVESPLDAIHVALVPLDGQDLASSGRMLLQVMTEEKPNGFEVSAADDGRYRIESMGSNPWLYRAPRGTVGLQRPDADRLTVTALDLNGYPVENLGPATAFALRPDTVYYLIER